MNKYNIDVTTYIIFIFLHSSIDKIVIISSIYCLGLYRATLINILKAVYWTIIEQEFLKSLKINNYVEH